MARVALALACSALIAGLSPGTAIAGADFVTSKDGRFHATPLPGKTWCGGTVTVRVEGPAGASTADPAALRKFMLGVRSAVTTECPNAVHVRMHAREGGVSAAWAYFSKATKWTPVVLAAAPDAAESLDTAAREEIADVDARAWIALTGAQHAKILPNRNHAVDAEWRISNVRLALTIEDNAATRKSLVGTARGAANRVARACDAVEGATLEVVETRLAQDFLICRKGNRSFGYAVIAYAYGRQRFVLGLYSPREELDKGRNIGAVLAALHKVILEEW